MASDRVFALEAAGTRERRSGDAMGMSRYLPDRVRIDS